MLGNIINNDVHCFEEDGVNIDQDWAPQGVTDQFLADADTYHSKYFNNDYWRYLVDLALSSANVDKLKAMKILDIGSGSGNTVFAAIDLLPSANIYASDISPDLLKILVRMQKSVPKLSGRIEAFCFDLHKDFFLQNQFDMVLGGAILHHLLDPQAALTNVAKWLRPGGHILLIEPQEIGAHMMAGIYLTLLAELEGEASAKLLSVMRAMVQDYEARFGVPNQKPWTAALDDKWFFHPAYMRQVARNIGLELRSVTPVNDLNTLFSDHVRGTLGLSGISKEDAPWRMWQILSEYDEGISLDLKKRLAPEGIICLSKPS